MRRLLSAFCLLAALGLAAPAYAKFKVVTTFTVIQDIAQNVAGDAAVVESITKPGAEIHDYQPTPQDIAKAQSADLVLWNGLNLERWFERFFQNVRNKPAVVVTQGITPMSIHEGPYRGQPNPHAWMSTRNALIYVENIKNALIKNWRGFRKTSVSWSPAKVRSAIWHATMVLKKCICGRLTPSSKARRNRCAA